jgi:acetyltransferase-like isoleucine patch superfamily enzyme
VNVYSIEALIFRVPKGLISRFKIALYKLLGMRIGVKNRFESGRIRRAGQIEVGSYNDFSDGYRLWPIDSLYNGFRIKIGDANYFNRNLMIDACGLIEIGNKNMFGPDIYITDSNHTFGHNVAPRDAPMQVGKVRIGNNCWIGAKATILKDVVLEDECVVAAGAVVTKSFPRGSIIAGIPARLIRRTSPELA